MMTQSGQKAPATVNRIDNGSTGSRNLWWTRSELNSQQAVPPI
jgi:hypothetical protein